MTSAARAASAEGRGILQNSGTPPRSTSPTRHSSSSSSSKLSPHHLLARRTLPRYVLAAASTTSAALQQQQQRSVPHHDDEDIDEVWKKMKKSTQTHGFLDSHVLSPICPNLRASSSARSSTPISKPSPPSPLHEDDEDNNASGLFSFSPSVTESPAVSLSIEEQQQQEKKGADEMMVWTNAAFQASINAEESEHNLRRRSCGSSLADTTPTYPPAASKPSSRSAADPSRFMMMLSIDANRRVVSDDGAPPVSGKLCLTPAAGGDDLEEIELEIKQLTERLKKLQVQKEQAEARRRQRQRPRWEVQQHTQTTEAATSSSFKRTTSTSSYGGVPTFKGLRASQPMKKKQYIPGSARVNAMIRAAAGAGEDESRPRKRLQDSSITTATTSCTVLSRRSKQRLENHSSSSSSGTRILHGYGTTATGSVATGGGIALKNRGRGAAAVSLSCQNLNAVAARDHRTSVVKFPPAAASSSSSAAADSGGRRRSSIVAKSLVSFLHGKINGEDQARHANNGDGAQRVDGREAGPTMMAKKATITSTNEGGKINGEDQARHANNGDGAAGAQRVDGREAGPWMMAKKATMDDHLLLPSTSGGNSAKPKSTAALYERLECLLRESQVFFEQKQQQQHDHHQQRRSRTAPSTPQAPKRPPIQLVLHTEETAAAPPAPPIFSLDASFPSHHHELRRPFPDYDDDDDDDDNELLMRKLQAIAASHSHSHDAPHHQTIPLPPPAASSSSLARNATNTGSARLQQALHFASPPRSRLLRSGRQY